MEGTLEPETADSVSLVLEPETDEDGHAIRLRDVLEAWREQTRRDAIRECLLVAPAPPSEEQDRAVASLFPVTWLVRPGLRYYENKNAGIAAARGAWIALADSDVLPCREWLERALVAAGRAPESAALITGRTRYAPGPFSRELAFFQWPNHSDRRSEAAYFLGHNVLMRADVARRFPFGQPHLRHGGDADLAERLRAAGHLLLYEPEMEMRHNYAAGLLDLWTHCVSRGGAEWRSLAARGIPQAGALREAIGRVRVLTRRLQREGRSVGLAGARLPLSLAAAAGYAVAMLAGRRRAQRGGEELREPF